MYGETPPAYYLTDRIAGLSPHVRGNRRLPTAARGCSGSIPACTGKPVEHGGLTDTREVYPRMYGETPTDTVVECGQVGLSPHVRGNRRLPTAARGCSGSIPACTGKPVEHGGLTDTREVYPRMYGETPTDTVVECGQVGLSPHVRGNQTLRPRPRLLERSIPACTGKPLARAPIGSRRQVYPRMYGETAATGRRRGGIRGLSPHVRGNLPNGTPDSWLSRSIPACTGKPRGG